MDSWTVRILMLVGALALVGVILVYHALMRRVERKREAAEAATPGGVETSTSGTSAPPGPTGVPAGSVTYARKERPGTH